MRIPGFEEGAWLMFTFTFLWVREKKGIGLVTYYGFFLEIGVFEVRTCFVPMLLEFHISNRKE